MNINLAWIAKFGGPVPDDATCAQYDAGYGANIFRWFNHSVDTFTGRGDILFSVEEILQARKDLGLDKTLNDCTPDEWTRASRAARGLEATPEEDERWKKKESKMIGEPPSKYHVCIKGVWLDVYDILQAYKISNPADQHAIKKMLMPGQRGAKDALQDRREAIQSLERAIELEAELTQKWPTS